MRQTSLLAALIFSTALSFGQTGLATITGTITDTSGAVVANAPISVKNLDNGQVYTAASSETGNYSVSQLPIGDYNLSVASPGFKTFAHNGFHLAAGQTMREDVLLEIGQATESVTVTADASLLKTESSELAHNVTLSQLDNLPILIVGATNSGFRDPFQALRLAPGVRYAGTGPATTTVINGTPANTVQNRLDGQTLSSTAPGLVGATMQTQPSVDAIQEVAIQTSNFAAELGTAGGAIVTMVSKSGTNQYHGTVYDYAINEILNASQPYTGQRNKIRQHDWGFTFGGPVRIPKLYNGTNKTFFFWSFEQYRENKIINTGSTTTPITEYRAGNFANLIAQENRLVMRTATTAYTDPLNRTIQSGTIFDPTTQQTVNGSVVRDPFPGNQIPLVRFDPVAVKILALVPQPFGSNAARGQAGSNYQAPYNQNRISEIPSIKIDQNLGSKGRLAFYWQRTSTSTPRSPTGVDNFPVTISTSLQASAYAPTIRLNYDYTATSRLLLHFGSGWNSDDFQTLSVSSGFDPFKELGLIGQTRPGTFPVIVTGNSGNALGGMSNLGSGSDSKTWERRPAGNVSASYVYGRHTYKAGAEYRSERFPSYNFSNTTGTYNFGTNWTQQTSLQGVTTSQGFTGFAFSSFLLGGMSGSSLAAPVAAQGSKSETSIYVQDNWKVTRKLTLDYGVRWDYGTYASEQHGRYSSFAPLVPNPSAAGRLGARQYESVCNCHFADNYPFAIGPRLGVAYQIDRKTVVRGGFGVVYNTTGTASGGLVNTATAGTSGFGQIVGLLKDGVPTEVHPVWPTTEPNAGHVVGTVSSAPPIYVDRNAGRPARLLQWNFTVQREVTRNLVVEAAYVANRGVWWDAGGLAPLNVLSEPVLRSYGFNNFTSATEAALLTTNIANLSAAQRSTLAARGIVLPYSNFPTNQTVRQSLLPFPQYTQNSGFTTWNPSNAPLGKNWYDSFQLTVNKRFSHGLNFNMNYNYAKTLELMSSPDVFNRQLGKNLGTFDLPHQFRFTAQYEVPRINSSLPVLKNKAVAYALSGWGIGWYLNYQSAALVGRPTSTSTTPISQFLGRGPGSAQLKKDANGNPMNPWSVDWFDYDGNHHTDPINVNCHCFDPTKTVVLNPAAWENIPDGQWGADQSSIRWFRGIRAPQENANLSRSIRFGKEGRYNLNLRVEFTNVFNRTVLSGIGLGNFSTAPTKFAPGSGANAGLYSGGFGTIVPTSGTTGMRTGVFVGRFTF